MKVAIIGTRGIPNNYGGFEQFAEYLSLGLVQRGHRVTVYNSHQHPYQDKVWNGVDIVHRYDPEEKIGTAGQFIYDLNCILDTRKKDFDIILQLGYTSSSIWGFLLPRKKSIVTTNMDGLEWKRTKFSKKVRSFLLYAEKLGVKYSDHLIADSKGISEYLENKYQKYATYIPYGSHLFTTPDESILAKYELGKYNYNMLVARLEPENSIEIILDGVVESEVTKPFLVIGKHETSYGEYLKNKYSNYNYIRFVGGIYDINALNNLRFYSNLYFHGHTVGGTNPSLLEAMGSQSLICANNNPFNKHILGEDALYFDQANDVAFALHETKMESAKYQEMVGRNTEKIKTLYTWDTIVSQYIDHFDKILGQRRSSAS